jgi:hypothetical protein
MKGKITLLVGGAVGYVLGTRAGRERYEQIKTQAEGLWNNPKVQEKATAAQDLVKEKAPLVKDKATGAASSATASAKDKVSGGSSNGSGNGSFDEPVVDEIEVVEVIEPAPYPTSASTGL